jgi:hypothetical protein
VDEVKRRKIEVTRFLISQFATLKFNTYTVPNHLLARPKNTAKRFWRK